MHTFPSGAFRVFRRTLYVAVDKHSILPEVQHVGNSELSWKLRICSGSINTYRSLKCLSEYTIFIFIYLFIQSKENVVMWLVWRLFQKQEVCILVINAREYLNTFWSPSQVLGERWGTRWTRHQLYTGQHPVWTQPTIHTSIYIWGQFQVTVSMKCMSVENPAMGAWTRSGRNPHHQYHPCIFRSWRS